jgi:hypothetical protein
LGLGVGAGLLALYELLPDSGLALPDGASFPNPADLRIGRYFAIMIGFYIAITPMLSRVGVREVGQIADLPAGRREALQRQVRRPSVPWLLGVLTLALGLHLTMLFLVGFRLEVLEGSPGGWSGAGVGFALSWVHIFCFGLCLSLIFTQGTLFGKIAHELPKVDLFDHGDLAPFVRVALRLALVFAITIALAIAFHFNWDEGVLARQSLLFLPIFVPLLLMVFLFPLWGAHERLRDARRDELRRIHAALRGEPAALRDSSLLRAGERLGTVELLAYRAQIQALGTWPVDATSRLRLALYLGIPLAGWIGGALVERVLNAALD